MTFTEKTETMKDTKARKVLQRVDRALKMLAEGTPVIQVGEHVFQVPSSTGESCHMVLTDEDTCSCKDMVFGGVDICKHQFLVVLAIEFGVVMDRRKIALGA